MTNTYVPARFRVQKDGASLEANCLRCEACGGYLFASDKNGHVRTNAHRYAAWLGAAMRDGFTELPSLAGYVARDAGHAPRMGGWWHRTRETGGRKVLLQLYRLDEAEDVIERCAERYGPRNNATRTARTMLAAAQAVRGGAPIWQALPKAARAHQAELPSWLAKIGRKSLSF